MTFQTLHPNEATVTSESQGSILIAIFGNGMTEEAKEHDPLIAQVAMDLQRQVKV